MIRLEPISLLHIEQLRVWRNEPNLRKFFRETKDITKENQQKWFERVTDIKNVQSIYFSIVDDSTEELVGCAGLHPIDWINSNAEISLFIGKNLVYIDENYANEALKQLLEYAFTELSLHKLIAETYEYDIKKQELFSKYNFSLEGRLKEKIRYNNKYYDSLFFSLINKNHGVKE